MTRSAMTNKTYLCLRAFYSTAGGTDRRVVSIEVIPLQKETCMKDETLRGVSWTEASSQIITIYRPLSLHIYLHTLTYIHIYTLKFVCSFRAQCL